MSVIIESLKFIGFKKYTDNKIDNVTTNRLQIRADVEFDVKHLSQSYDNLNIDAEVVTIEYDDRSFESCELRLANHTNMDDWICVSIAIPMDSTPDYVIEKCNLLIKMWDTANEQ